jgi:hypothetical protein
MWEWLAYGLLGAVMICCLLYVTMSPEVEETRNPNRPDRER